MIMAMMKKNGQMMTIMSTSEYGLRNPYPNPFIPVTTISYDLPLEGHIKLVVYDLMGRQVDILYNGMQYAGYHNVSWNAGWYASGLYFVTIIADENVNTQKMMLIK